MYQLDPQLEKMMFDKENSNKEHKSLLDELKELTEKFERRLREEELSTTLATTDFKSKKYWLERGKIYDQYDGFVCLGKGNETPLSETLNLGISDLYSSLNLGISDLYSVMGEDSHSVDCGKLTPNWSGSSAEAIYYVKNDVFNKLFNKGYVIKPLNKDHERAIKKRLFKLGYKWVCGGDDIIDFNLNPIFITNDKFIYCDYLTNDLYKEITLDDLYAKDLFFT